MMVCLIYKITKTHLKLQKVQKKCRRGRGPTRMSKVFTRGPDEKKIIKLNCELQAVADEDKDLAEFKNFLGTLGRQSVPLDIISWHKFPDQQKELWNFVKEQARKNVKNRKLIVETHTVGRKSFAQIGEKIKAKKNIEPEKLAPKYDIYVKTRKRRPGRQYKTITIAENGTEEEVPKPSHGPNWLLGRSGKCGKAKAQQLKLLSSSTATTTDIDGLKKSLREDIMAEMKGLPRNIKCNTKVGRNQSRFPKP